MTPLKWVLVLLGLVAVMVLAVFRHGTQPLSKPDNHQASRGTATSSSTAGRTSQPQPSAPKPDENKLKQELAGFVAAYYRIGPDDTTASRTMAVDRTGIAISSDARSSMDFTVYVSSDADQMRINDRLTLTGTIRLPDITVRSRQLGGKRLYVSVPVSITATWPNGKVDTKPPVMLGTVWVWQSDGSWIMTAFGESGRVT